MLGAETEIFHMKLKVSILTPFTTVKNLEFFLLVFLHVHIWY